MEAILGNSLSVFIGLTLIIIGSASYLTGQAVAATWRPVWQVVLFCVLLGFVDRFLTFALFEGDGLSISGFVIDTIILVAIGLFAHRITHVTKVVAQYPWIYERASPWSYRKRPQS